MEGRQGSGLKIQGGGINLPVEQRSEAPRLGIICNGADAALQEGEPDLNYTTCWKEGSCFASTITSGVISFSIKFV